MKRHRWQLVVAGRLFSLMWGGGFGLRLRVHQVQSPGALSERATHRIELKFRPNEWDRIAQAARAEHSSVYNFLKHTVLADV